MVRIVGGEARAHDGQGQSPSNLAYADEFMLRTTGLNEVSDVRACTRPAAARSLTQIYLTAQSWP